MSPTSMRRIATAGVSLVLATTLAGCADDETSKPTAEATEMTPIAESEGVAAAITVDNYPTRWAENWCAARAAATREDAESLMGEPTREWGHSLYWEASDPTSDSPGFQLSVGLGSTDQVTSFGALNVPEEFPDC